MARSSPDFVINDAEWQQALKTTFDGFAADARAKMPLILEVLGQETIAYLRSHTGEMRPPARRPGGKMTGTRPAHPGGWADITGDLARAYSFDIEQSADEFVLVFRNTMEYAIYLEMRDGYFVLSGVTERNGPVERALRSIVPRVAPGWTVV